MREMVLTGHGFGSPLAGRRAQDFISGQLMRWMSPTAASAFCRYMDVSAIRWISLWLQHLTGAWGFFVVVFPASRFASACISAQSRSHAKHPHGPFHALGIRNTLPLCLSQPSDLRSRAGSREGTGQERTGREEEEETIHPALPTRSRSLQLSLRWKKVTFKRGGKKKQKKRRQKVFCPPNLLGPMWPGVTYTQTPATLARNTYTGGDELIPA